MATLVITVPDAQVQRVLDAFAATYSYSATIPDPANEGQTLPNPETKTQFCRRMLRRYIVDVVKAYESTSAAEAARTTAAAGVETQLNLS